MRTLDKTLPWSWIVSVLTNFTVTMFYNLIFTSECIEMHFMFLHVHLLYKYTTLTSTLTL